MKLTGIVIVALLATGIARAQTPPPPAQALPPPDPPQGAPPPDEAGPAATAQSESLVVTADRAPTPASGVGQSVTVLNREAIQADQETSVADLLARTPGVSVARNGGPGQTASLFLRGADSAQTLVLIDGVPANDPADPATGFDFSNLLTGDIARIEVLRGPQSTLYGSAAIGGVVNIITSDPTAPFQASGSAEGGSYGTATERLEAGGRQGPLAWRAGGIFTSTDGISAFDRAFGGSEPDAFHGGNVSARASYAIRPNIVLEQRLYYAKSRTNFDGYDTPGFTFGDDREYNHAEQLISYTGLTVSLWDGRFRNRIAYTLNTTSRQDYDPAQPVTTETFATLGRADRGEYEGTLALTRALTLIVGATAERDAIKAASPSAFDPTPPTLHAAITTNSGYAQATFVPLAGLTLTGGVRVEDHSTFGSHATGQAALAYALPGGATVLRASWGQGFKAPSLYELYSEYGNLRLRPEEANGWDAGIEHRAWGGRLLLGATYFGRKTTNLIDFASCFGVVSAACARQPFGYYANLAQSTAHGIELEATARPLPAVQLDGNLTWQDVEDTSPGSPSQGKQLARRPHLTANASATWHPWAPLGLTAAVRYLGQSWDDAAHAIRLASATLLDLRAAWRLTPHLELTARIENATNDRYETVYQYGTPGRTAYAGLRAGFP